MRSEDLQRAILERARAELVRRYRRAPSVWPEGIDTQSDRWYGDGAGWTEERIKAALSDDIFRGLRVPEGAVVKVGAPRKEDRDVTLTALEPWKELGMSRASWYRRKEK